MEVGGRRSNECSIQDEDPKQDDWDKLSNGWPLCGSCWSSYLATRQGGHGGPPGLGSKLQTRSCTHRGRRGRTTRWMTKTRRSHGTLQESSAGSNSEGDQTSNA